MGMARVRERDRERGMEGGRESEKRRALLQLFVHSLN